MSLTDAQRASRARREKNLATPIRIRGVDYPSMRSAARALGVSNTTIMRALDRGTLETCGNLARNAGTIDGVWYYCKADAARERGINKFTFAKQIRRGVVEWIPTPHYH